MDNSIKLQERILELRKDKGITQTELANSLGISFQSVSKWENGTAYPDITMLPKISRYFSVTVDYLLGLDIRSNIEKGYFLAADQGGTKTRVQLCRFDGEIVDDITCAGACWFYVGIDKAIECLAEAVDSLKARAGIVTEEIAFIICGAAGINWDDEQGMFTEEVERQFNIKAYIYNDCAAAAYCDGIDYPNRIVLCAGTEFGAAVITDKMSVPFVFCNYTLPTDMGATAIGDCAINAVFRSEQALSDKTSLNADVLEYFSLNSASELHQAYRRKKLDKHPKGLTPIVFKHATMGDKVSEEILLEIAKNMAMYARASIIKYQLKSKLAIILAGGVFKNEYAPFYKKLEDEIKALCPSAVIIRTDNDIVKGAYNIGMIKAKKHEKTKL